MIKDIYLYMDMAVCAIADCKVDDIDRVIDIGGNRAIIIIDAILSEDGEKSDKGVRLFWEVLERD